MSTDSSETQTFYRYEDPSGRVVIVDSLDKLPPSAQPRAERVELAQDADTMPSLPARPTSASADFSLWSFALGVGITLLFVTIAAWFRRRRPSLLVRLITGAVLVALMVGLYLGLVRRTVNPESDLLSSPKGVIEDAQRTLEQAKEKRREQQRLLDEIGKAR